VAKFEAAKEGMKQKLEKETMMARDYQQKYEQAVADLDKRNSSLNDLYS